MLIRMYQIHCNILEKKQLKTNTFHSMIFTKHIKKFSTFSTIQSCCPKSIIAQEMLSTFHNQSTQQIQNCSIFFIEMIWITYDILLAKLLRFFFPNSIYLSIFLSFSFSLINYHNSYSLLLKYQSTTG